MRYYHRHSLFPLVIIALSIVLVGFMFFAFQDRAPSDAGVVVPKQQVEPVKEDEYRASLRDIIQTFETRMDEAEDDSDRLFAAQTALSDILALRVPAGYKDLHLGLAVALNGLRVSLERDDSDMADALADVEALIAQNSWITQ